MNSAAPQSLIDETNTLPIARIDAQEEEFVIPLREYLETNGCQVVINQPTAQSVVYHIAAGDFFFVKDIFSAAPDAGIRRLGIVVGSASSDAEKLAVGQTKIIVVDPVHVSPSDVMEIFSFFFAETSMFFDKRRNRHEHAPYGAEEIKVNDVHTPEEQMKEVVREIPSPHNADEEQVLSEEDQKRIGNIISDVFRDDTNDSGEGQEKKQRRGRRKKNFGLWAYVISVFFLILFPLFWYVGSLTAAGGAFAFVGSRMKEGDTSGAASFMHVGQYWLYQSKFAFTIVGTPFKILGLTHLVRGQERLLSFLTDISGAFNETQKIILMEKEVASILLLSHAGDESPSTPASSIERLRISVTSVQGSLGLAQAELSTLLRDQTFPFFIPVIFQVGSQTESTIGNLRGVLTYVDQILTLYPHLAGFKEPKTYLVLLQNSNELRPTGGFIGSVGVAKFEEGFLSDFTIQDVYALDGQLKGHVDPPLPIRELLAQEHWYLRDSNWDPDFKASAERAIWFYEKETGGVVDGVIAVNVPVIVDVLQATGPIVLSDYNDRITAENFFGKSIFYTQANFFPGSTQKSDFLGTLARTIMTKITTEKDINPVSLFHAFAAGIGRRDIMFMFAQDDLQQLVEHYGWSGRMFNESGCKGVSPESCFFNPVAVVEANLSVSKVNYFVKHDGTREIVIAPDGTVSENITVGLKNTFTEAAGVETRGVGGGYRTYMRFIIPSESLVSDVTLDGTPIVSRNTKSKDLPTVPYIETSDSSPGTRAIGAAIDVPPGSEKKIRISYKHNSPLPFGRGGAVMDLLWYKHPGVSDAIAKTVIRYPVFWVAIDETQYVHSEIRSSLKPESGGVPAFLAKDGELEYNTTVLQDQFIRLKFTK